MGRRGVQGRAHRPARQPHTRRARSGGHADRGARGRCHARRHGAHACAEAAGRLRQVPQVHGRRARYEDGHAQQCGGLPDQRGRALRQHHGQLRGAGRLREGVGGGPGQGRPRSGGTQQRGHPRQHPRCRPPGRRLCMAGGLADREAVASSGLAGDGHVEGRLRQHGAHAGLARRHGPRAPGAGRGVGQPRSHRARHPSHC